MHRAAALCFLLSVSVQAAEPAFSKQEQDAALAAIGDYARNWVASLPNYTATQLTRRKMTPVAVRGMLTVRAQTELMEDQISYVDRREVHKTVSIDGKKLAEADQKDASYSRGEFAGLLTTLFTPSSGGKFEWDKFASLNGRKMYVFKFQVPQLPTGYGLMEGNHTIMVPFRGSVYADVQTKAVMRIQVKCFDIPAISSYRTVELVLDYKAAKVGGQEFVLPSHYTLTAGKADVNIEMDATYKNYQRFSADATIIFDEAGEP
ncbi:MAG: hypothetical protein ABIR70_06445 [Bryobacteraceae bacterium]